MITLNTVMQDEAFRLAESTNPTQQKTDTIQDEASKLAESTNPTQQKTDTIQDEASKLAASIKPNQQTTDTIQDESSILAASTNPTQQTTDIGGAALNEPSFIPDDELDGVPSHFATIEKATILADKNGKFLGANTRGAYGPLDSSKSSTPIQEYSVWVEGIDHTFSTKFLNCRDQSSEKGWYGEKEIKDEKVLREIMEDSTNRFINHVQNPDSSGQGTRDGQKKVTLTSRYDAAEYISLMNAPEYVRKRESYLDMAGDGSSELPLEVRGRLSVLSELPLKYRNFRWNAGKPDPHIKSYRETEVGYQANLNWEDPRITDPNGLKLWSKLSRENGSLKPIGPEPGSSFMGHIVEDTDADADLPKMPKVDLSLYKAHKVY